MRKFEQRLEELDNKLSSLLSGIEKYPKGRESKRSLATRAKILASSITAQAVEVTDIVTETTVTYPSARRAAMALNASNSTIMNKLNKKNSKLFRGRYVIKASPVSDSVGK